MWKWALKNGISELENDSGVQLGWLYFCTIPIRKACEIEDSKHGTESIPTFCIAHRSDPMPTYQYSNKIKQVCRVRGNSD